MRLSAAQEAAQWEDGEQMSSEDQSDLSYQSAEMSQQMKELDARQARIENHLIKLLPSAKKSEAQFATIVLAGKELREEMSEHQKSMATTLTQYREHVTTTAGEIKGEFQHQLKILKVFFDETMKMCDKNEQMVERCQKMVETSSGVYQKGSMGVLEVSEKTQAHLKAAADTHRKEIEAQAQHFKMIYKRLSKLIVIGTIGILLCAFVAGTLASAMWSSMGQHQAEETRR
jgi:flagellar basal body-associated protein FliL